MQVTKAAFRLSITREERPQGDLFEQATGPNAYHVGASYWPAEEQSAHEVLVCTTSAARPRILTRN
jgi:hypothetical protein